MTVVAVVAYTSARAWEFRGSSPRFLPDTIDYHRIASEPISGVFFGDVKPWAVPLFYKALPNAAEAAPLAQLAISIGSWLVLAFTFGGCFRHPLLRRAATAAVLAFSCSTLIAQWDDVLLSESLSLSMLALVLATAIRLARQPRPAMLVAFLALGGLWSATRDTNMWAWLGLALVAGLMLLRRKPVLAGVLAVGATAVVGASAWAAASPQRWEPLMLDNISERVLSNPKATQYFVSRGMPVPPNLRRRLVQSRRPLSRFDHDPTLQPFRKWMLRSGRPTYLRYLASHPRKTIWDPTARLGLLLSPVALDFFRPPGFTSIVPRPIDHLLFIRSGRTALIWLLILTALSVVAAIRRDRPGLLPASATAAIFITSTLAVLIADAEPREVSRHELIPIVLSRLSLLALGLAILASVTAGNPSRRKRRPALLTRHPQLGPPQHVVASDTGP
jgi:hypothetical protein